MHTVALPRLRLPLLAGGGPRHVLRHDYIVETIAFLDSARRRAAGEVVARQLTLSERVSQCATQCRQLAMRTSNNVEVFRRHERRIRAS